MTSEKLLEIKDLYVQYETDDGIFHSVNGVNLTLHKGETMGLVGETGAGKTTTCLSVMRLLPKGTGIITNGSFPGNLSVNAPKIGLHASEYFCLLQPLT